MVMSELPEPKSADEASQQAVDWQMWASEESPSSGGFPGENRTIF